MANLALRAPVLARSVCFALIVSACFKISTRNLGELPNSNLLIYGRLLGNFETVGGLDAGADSLAIDEGRTVGGRASGGIKYGAVAYLLTCGAIEAG